MITCLSLFTGSSHFLGDSIIPCLPTYDEYPRPNRKYEESGIMLCKKPRTDYVLGLQEMN